MDVPRLFPAAMRRSPVMRGRARPRRLLRSLPALPPLRRKRRPSWRERATPWLIAGGAAAAGAVTLFVFDPQVGRRRRARARDRAAHAAHVSSRRLRHAARASAARLAAIRQRAVHALAGGPPVPADDRTLLDRIESQVFRDQGLPKGALNLDVVDAVAVLRGAVRDPAFIALFEERVRAIPGVRGVENLLHVAGTDAPNKHAAIAASHAGSDGHMTSTRG